MDGIPAEKALDDMSERLIRNIERDSSYAKQSFLQMENSAVKMKFCIKGLPGGIKLVPVEKQNKNRTLSDNVYIYSREQEKLGFT